VARDSNGSFTANVGTFTTVSGAGGGLTSINASNLSSGTVATARLGSGTANASTFLRGDQTYATVTSPNNGTLTMNVSGTGLSGSATFTADQAGASTFTVTSNATSANGASTIVARDSNGSFTGNVITGTTITATSDERLKENWTDVAPDFIFKLAQVKHGVFSRKDSGNREPGIGAQSFMTVLPEAVVEGADGFLSVNYGGAALVAAIELAKVVEELRAEIAELKAK
jgi:hypothetical protein